MGHTWMLLERFLYMVWDLQVGPELIWFEYGLVHVLVKQLEAASSNIEVMIPSARLLETVTVKCGHCSNLSFLSSRPPLQGQCLDHQLSLQGCNYSEKPGLCSEHSKKGPSSSLSSSFTSNEAPVSRRTPFVVKSMPN